MRVSESQISAHRVARARDSSEEDLSQDQHVAADLPTRERESSSSDRSSSDPSDPERDLLWQLWADRYERVRRARPIRHGGGDEIDLAKIARSIAEHAERDGVTFAELAGQTLDLYWSAPWARTPSNHPTIANLREWFETYLARARKLLRPAPAKTRPAAVASFVRAAPNEVPDVAGKLRGGGEGMMSAGGSR